MTGFTEVIVDQRELRLDRRIGKGGEGEVYTVRGDTSLAVKIYTVADGSSREAKIAAMLRAELAKTAPLVAYPLSIARARDGRFLGFVMRLVTACKPLHELYAPGPRKQHFPQADYRFLVRTATNIARAVASVHKAGCVIGDINHSSVLVSSQAIVALIDADSFQVTEGSRRYACKVGVPEYTPPELQGRRLDTIIRTPNHDAFGLAVIIFQLLFMGRHPFVGTVRIGDIPPLHENIANYRYVYAANRDVGMDQPPGTPAIQDFYDPIAPLFESAFFQESANKRPSAEEWARHLAALETSLTKCSENPLHFAPRDASECAWCEMERELHTVLFLPQYKDPGVWAQGIDPGGAAFNLAVVWAQIQAIRLPTSSELNPKISIPPVEPSQAARSAKSARNTINPIGVMAMLAAAGGIFAAPGLALVWIGLFAYGAWSWRKPADTSQTSQFTTTYSNAEIRWNETLAGWRRRVGLQAVEEMRSDLQSAKAAYEALLSEQKALVDDYRKSRRERQLDAYLDQFDVQHADLSGIGPAGKATLASYGIDTAADITREKMQGVVGFGEVKTVTLLAWRMQLESGFVYRAAEDESDRRHIAALRNAIEARAIPLRKKLSAGPANLRAAITRMQANSATSETAVTLAWTQLEQAREDLRYLGIPIPTSRPAPTAPGQSTSRSPGNRTTPSASGVAPLCPRCSSKMVRRLARRGRYAGRHFWGCSRYPKCKGTRNT